MITESACRHDQSERSTLMWTISAPPQGFAHASLRCSVCRLQLVGVRERPAWSLLSRAVEGTDLQNVSFALPEVRSSSLPTVSSSSSPAPTQVAAGTSGREASPKSSPPLKRTISNAALITLSRSSACKGLWEALLISNAGWVYPLEIEPRAAEALLAERIPVRWTPSSDGFAVVAGLDHLSAAEISAVLAS